jgi:DNA polymerase I-like protein with 3'-5' exonuclease and polymerase domains
MKNEGFLNCPRHAIIGKTIVAMDTETHLISAEAVSPPVVCVSLAVRETPDHIDGILLAAHEQATEDMLKALLTDDEVVLVGHRMSYDLGVIHTTWPQLTPLVWDKLAKGLVTDTAIREKLLNLSTLGDVDNTPTPGGKPQRVDYSLAALGMNYLGIDRSDEKEGEDIWRLRYGELAGVPISEYPQEAYQYAVDDAIETLMVWEAQEQRIGNVTAGPGSCNTHEFQTAVDYALRRMTMNGVRVDEQYRQELMDELDEEMSEENLKLLVQSGIMRPSQPARPHANQKKRVREVFPNLGVDWNSKTWWDRPWDAEDLEILRAEGVKITKPKKSSICEEVLHSIIESVCEENNIEVKKTETDRTAADADFLKEIAHLDPILEQYKHRQELARLWGTELPKIAAPRIHPNFDILKETGRTSSKGNKKGKMMEPYPSTNIQQVDPRARNCFIPDDGCVFTSVDYSALELVSVAQRTYSLFGHSVHRDKVLAGYDLHAFLGSQLAFHLDDEFANYCEDCSSMDEVYERFIELKDGPEEQQEFFEHWRKFAKPTGLGYPGGLGAKTFITYAAGTYGVHVDEDTAKDLKEIWLSVYSEMVDFFKWINTEAVDPTDDSLYCYETPLGMWRARAHYCAAANGTAMQSPSAEGAKLAVFRVMRACDDPQDALYGAQPWAFIHDELMVQIPEDENMAVRAERVGQLMVEAMSVVFPDVPIEAEPALMRRWDKKAKTVRDRSGRLMVWTPKEK